MPSNQLCEYYRVEACRKYGSPNEVVFRSISSILSECMAPADQFNYNGEGYLTGLVLWGKDLPKLKRMAEFLLCKENEPKERSYRTAPPARVPALQFSGV